MYVRVFVYVIQLFILFKDRFVIALLNFVFAIIEVP